MIITGVLLAFAPLLTAGAQPNTCPAIVQAAAASTLLECDTVAAGEVCYGNAFITAEGADLSRRGDRATLGAVDVLRSGPMSLDRGEWGMAVMRVQGNTSQQVMTYVVVGDVELENAADAREPVYLPDVRVREVTGANVRARPAEDTALVTRLSSGQVVQALGWLADESWLLVLLPDTEAGFGWVRADLMRVEGERDRLRTLRPTAQPPANLYSPMQAFNFQSGIYAAFCAAAPDSGVLVQSADRSGQLTLRVNEIDVRFEGTFFIQAEIEGEMTVSVLEGAVTLTVDDSATTVEAGSRVRLPWDAEAEQYAAPLRAEEYRYLRMRTLPLEVLPRPDIRLDFNLIDLVIPAPRTGGPLDGLNADSVCTVAAVEEVRLRQGPGQVFPITSRLLAGESARPDARAEGADGVLWWRLTDDFWVRSDVVLWQGNCPDLPIIPAPPPPAD